MSKYEDVINEIISSGEASNIIEQQEEEIASLRQRLAAAEKERDESQRREIDVTRRLLDAEARLSLYESAPSEPEVKEAMEWLQTLNDNLKDYGIDDGPPKVHLPVLLRELRSCQAKLSEAEQIQPDLALLDKLAKERKLWKKAESELAAARAKIEEIASDHCCAEFAGGCSRYNIGGDRNLHCPLSKAKAFLGPKEDA